ncbi:MAG: 16S rRNA (adenine(1518)-N(6)/adenine(1519)-N(6))-dimethyltransferase RsmA [Candidatus Binatia bacterium]
MKVTLYQEARAALRESAFKPRKKLGQHFLIHEGIIEAILRLVGLSQEDEIVEIGPGLGFLTRRLVEVAHKVWAIEVDPFLVGWLRRSPLGSHPAFELIHGDVLKVPLNGLLPDHKVKLVANLPYSISTPVLFRLFELREHFSLLVLMVQREVAERMAASPGTKSYGTLSIWCQIHGQILDKVSVSPEAFFPRPRVRSTVLQIGLYPKPLLPSEDISLFRGLVRSAFGKRRKILSNALGGLLDKGRGEIEVYLRQEGIDPQRRGETLSVDEFIRLARALKTGLRADS